MWARNRYVKESEGLHIYFVIVLDSFLSTFNLLIKFFKMVKNEVLGRIRNFGGYGSICLGREINVAGSAKFLPPDFQN